MMRHHLVKNRQQSLLNRAAAEMGVDTVDTLQQNSGKLDPSFSHLYDRSSATMS